MKTLLPLIVAAAATVSGCGEAFNPTACRQNVVEEMGTADVVQVRNRDFHFIVRKKDGSVWYVETLNGRDAKVSAKTMLFAPILPAEGGVQ